MKIKHLALIFFLFGGNKAIAQNIHSFLFCNTNDSKISQSAKKNFFNFDDLSQKIARATGFRLVPHYVIGNRFDKQIIEREIREAVFAPNDIVIVYLSSHGANRKKDANNFPIVSVSDVFMSSFGIYKELSKKKPKTLITIVEACNGYKHVDDKQIRFLYRQSAVDLTITKMQPQAVRNTNIRNLFNSGCRFIVCAGQPGMDTWATSDGSIFSNNLLRAFNIIVENPKKQATWLEILQTSHKYTFDETRFTTLKHYPVWSNPKCNVLISQSIDDDSTQVFIQEPIIESLIDTTIVGPKKKSLFSQKRYFDFILAIKDTANVDTVVYYLHHTFPDSIVSISNRRTRFRYKLLNVYGEFPIKALIIYKDGSRVETFHEIAFPTGFARRRQED